MIRHQSLVRHPPPEVPDGDTTGDAKAAEDAEVKKKGYQQRTTVVRRKPEGKEDGLK